jgi:hypothetical protein
LGATTLQALMAADIEDAGIERPNDFIALTRGQSIVNTGPIAGMPQIEVPQGRHRAVYGQDFRLCRQRH